MAPERGFVVDLPIPFSRSGWHKEEVGGGGGFKRQGAYNSKSRIWPELVLNAGGVQKVLRVTKNQDSLVLYVYLLK